MRVAIYTRCSTKQQGDEDRYGLPSQRAAIERFCHKAGHEVMREYSDLASGATANRPALAELLNDAASGAFSAVIVAKWDRLARNTTLDGFLRYQLQNHKVVVLSATETNGIDDVSTLTQQILSAVAQFERSLITQRLLAARKVKNAAGGYAYGCPRFGTKAQGKALVTNEAEVAIVAEMRRLRRAHKSYREIVNALNEQGLRPRHAAKWCVASVYKTLKRSKKILNSKIAAEAVQESIAANLVA